MLMRVWISVHAQLVCMVLDVVSWSYTLCAYMYLYIYTYIYVIMHMYIYMCVCVIMHIYIYMEVNEGTPPNHPN